MLFGSRRRIVLLEIVVTVVILLLVFLFEVILVLLWCVVGKANVVRVVGCPFLKSGDAWGSTGTRAQKAGNDAPHLLFSHGQGVQAETASVRLKAAAQSTGAGLLWKLRRRCFP
jgi:hypothetical protein